MIRPALFGVRPSCSQADLNASFSAGRIFTLTIAKPTPSSEPWLSRSDLRRCLGDFPFQVVCLPADGRLDFVDFVVKPSAFRLSLLNKGSNKPLEWEGGCEAKV